MTQQPAILVTQQDLDQLHTFADRAVRSDHIQRAEIRRLAAAHAEAVQELAVVRMALSRKDLSNALDVLEALMRHCGAHAVNVFEPLPAGVVDLDQVRTLRAATAIAERAL